jgi:hypothetical protein
MGSGSHSPFIFAHHGSIYTAGRQGLDAREELQPQEERVWHGEMRQRESCGILLAITRAYSQGPGGRALLAASVLLADHSMLKFFVLDVPRR